MKFIDWEPCPRCNSKKVKSTSIGKGKMFAAGLIILSFSIWLLIIPPIGLLGIMGGLAIMLISPFIKKRNTFACLDCKNIWEHIANSKSSKSFFDYNGTI